LILLTNLDSEAEMVGNTTHPMTQIAGTQGINVPYYAPGGDSNIFKRTGVVCTHLHKFHQGTHAPDAIRNNLHETIMHSKCVSAQGDDVNPVGVYPNNTVLLTGMMAFGNPGGYKRFCGDNRDLLVCPDGQEANGKCRITDPLISQLPNSVYSNTLGRNMVDRSCLENVDSITGSFYFNPYEIWQGDLRITKADGTMLAEHGRQWDVLDPVRFVDPNSATGMSATNRITVGLSTTVSQMMNTKSLLRRLCKMHYLSQRKTHILCFGEMNDMYGFCKHSTKSLE
jgi:hypothetical protein